tara:strand:- start:13599 stop:14063 length:465 start_codon:yes stop_codon:yes gene_type:complete
LKIIKNNLDSVSVLSALNRSGYRTTATRRKIVEAIFYFDNGFTVEDLIKNLPDLGRATIFRNVKILKDLEIICQVFLGDGQSVYQLDFESNLNSHHHHLICSKCKCIQEFNNKELEVLLSLVSEEMSFEIDTHRLELYGYCSNCKTSKPSEIQV